MKTNDVVLSEALAALAEGTLLYPTDTIWGIGGDARSTSAVEKVYTIKKREDEAICLVATETCAKNTLEKFIRI